MFKIGINLPRRRATKMRLVALFFRIEFAVAFEARGQQTFRRSALILLSDLREFYAAINRLCLKNSIEHRETPNFEIIIANIK